MSSILKALRKIEEEKRTASHAAPDLRMDQGNSSKKGWPFLPLFAGVVLGAVCVGLFTFWSSSKTPAVVALPVQQPIVTGAENRQAASPAVGPGEKLLSVPVKLQTVPSEEQTADPVAETKLREVILPAETVPAFFEQTESPKQQIDFVSESKPSPEVGTQKIVAPTTTRVPEVEQTATRASVVEQSATRAPVVKPAVTRVPEVEQTATSAPVVEQAVTKLQKAEPSVVKSNPLPEGVHLKVSETFYHEDPDNSMAVVNDLPVMIGTFVDSAMVLEIHSDKVVFKIDESTYDVPVNPSP